MKKNRQFWNEAVETLSPQEIKALQWKRLKKQLRYNFENSVYYREQKFQKARTVKKQKA
jgi:phenylacetate-coenzyme A ligase PaaK-like adenylate-forming protein